MPSFVRRLFVLTALSTSSLVSYGQQPTTSQALQQLPEPFFIMNSTVIINAGAPRINPKNIKGIIVYKDQSADVPGLLRSLASSGIIAATYDGKIDSKTFAQLGSSYGLRGPLDFVLNGHRLSAAQVATLRIAPEAIGQVQITYPTADTAATVVAIRLAKTKTTNSHSPGTILLR
ncbi:hypothetical protein E5K02_13350 [Hymenobacter metallicola]|uniref:Uncharacterized protein n=2 Tax=Hymenobacter metallicola TaxID=2563114 RepID=A0A4Z0QCF1_9BACT|nr:hypothetical protein E5K02_13350 [Hymenobacter metallicola]